MKLKERQPIFKKNLLKSILNLISKPLINRKTKILITLLIVFGIFVIGIFSGLIISGYFGTFDEPSENARAIIHNLGITNLRNTKNTFDSIAAENIKIPINYITAQFSDVEKISIDIAFEDWQRIEFKRKQAIQQGVLISSNDDTVPAQIRFGDKTLNANIRLKGDFIDHLKGDKWSFRIKMSGNDRLYGIRTFSLQDPKRRNYISEYIYHEALKREGVPHLRYKFLEVDINGVNKGIYALEEHFDKELIEYNKDREGVLVKFNEDIYWEERLENLEFFNEVLIEDDEELFKSSSLDTFQPNKAINDPVLNQQLIKANTLLEAFRTSELETTQVFDTDKLARYFAINTVLGAIHAADWRNIRFYYNPITSKLEPIGFDAIPGKINYEREITETYFPDCIRIKEQDICDSINTKYFQLFFQDPAFFKKYIEELERISQDEYLTALFKDLSHEIDAYIKIIHKDTPYYHFFEDDFYRNQKLIHKLLNPETSLNSYYHGIMEGQIILAIGNIQRLPIELTSVTYNDTYYFTPIYENKILQPKISGKNPDFQIISFNIPDNIDWRDNMAKDLKISYKIYGSTITKTDEVWPWKNQQLSFLKSDPTLKSKVLSEHKTIIVDDISKVITIPAGRTILNKNLVIPAGYKLVAHPGAFIDMVENSMILSYSPVIFQASKDMPIKLTSSDGSGQGLTVIYSNSESLLENVKFSNLNNPSKPGWSLTGAVNFYESPVKISSTEFLSTNSEDALNVIGSIFELSNSKFNNTFSDSLDVDFGKGKISNVNFDNCGNDALDFSGSEISLENIDITNCGDKGISVGEKSKVQAKDVTIKGGYICVASKDLSELEMDKLLLDSCDYGFALYQKKPEYGPSKITATKVEITKETKQDYIIEKGSELSLNGKIILENQNNVYKELYDE